MTTLSRVNISEAQAFAREANRLRDNKALEEPMKLNLFHHLPLIFTERPTWISHHVSGAESMLRIATESGTAGRFADSLIGFTSIEYEPDLRRDSRFQTGFKQVKEFCAGLLNSGAPIDKVIGVLSDTVLWHAYTVELIDGAEIGNLTPDDIELTLIERIEVKNDSIDIVKNFIDFLERYLGRRGSRPLNADNVRFDLGFDGLVGRSHATAVAEVVESAFAARPKYAKLIELLWVRFVAVAGSGAERVEFDRDDYANELYLVTLAKLIAANVLAGRAIRSDDQDITAILSGSYFQTIGLDNVVEYDYFGWLMEQPHSGLLLPVAKSMQEDLHAYDFATVPAEDVFGQLMAVLGERSHRLLLGQEFTPAWLCSLMADELLRHTPSGIPLRAVDMCCGSGAMLAAISNRYRERLVAEGHEAGEVDALRLLIESATGFDIDPLAVMLAKVNWLIANRDWLVPGERVTIPVYHADSLFVGVPFADNRDESNNYRLTLYGDIGLNLPEFLINPECRQIFDDILHRAYYLVREIDDAPVEQEAINAAIEGALNEFPDFTGEQETQIGLFFGELVVALLELQKAGLNGLWAFVLRNCYRPSLVAGQFNALISNPPWLALSKIAANPYGEALRLLARQLSLTPPGAAHLHTELATIFLSASVDRFLVSDGTVVCILPDAVLNGFQHTPFRTGIHMRNARRVPLLVDNLWRIARGTFKNEAIVLVGRKQQPGAARLIPGKRASRTGIEEGNPFNVITRGNRTVWSDLPTESNPTGFFDAGNFRQGADLMPRTAVFHALQQTGRNRWIVGEINRQSSPLRYLVKDAKRLKDFSIASGTVDERFILKALLSNHLTPFTLAEPAIGLLPATRQSGAWKAVTLQVLAADRGSAQVFRTILEAIELDSPTAYLDMVETDRRKLSSQRFDAGKYLVVYGAGGGVVCAAYRQLTGEDVQKLAIDQTLYWHMVSTEEEALYLVGMFNSPAIASVIAAFQPQGQQGERHIHRLPAMVTPRFDPTDPAHQAVVEVTRNFKEEVESLIQSNTLLYQKLNPNNALASRRLALRRAFEGLTTFQEFNAVTQRVFDYS